MATAYNYRTRILLRYREGRFYGRALLVRWLYFLPNHALNAFVVILRQWAMYSYPFPPQKIEHDAGRSFLQQNQINARVTRI